MFCHFDILYFDGGKINPYWSATTCRVFSIDHPPVIKRGNGKSPKMKVLIRKSSINGGCQIAVCHCQRLVRYRTAHNTSILEKKIEHLLHNGHVQELSMGKSTLNHHFHYRTSSSCRDLYFLDLVDQLQTAGGKLRGRTAALFRWSEGGATYGTVRQYGKCKDV